jgi:hypothetical protein
MHEGATEFRSNAILSAGSVTRRGGDREKALGWPDVLVDVLLECKPVADIDLLSPLSQWHLPPLPI